ncbi:MAG TPA: sugar ABC transporter permease, partial [Candidatus Ozemobacteraceae bacterium]|nr:sugar ABC transporter permease [Candidatus Ozemobacteraceae bacterium]
GRVRFIGLDNFLSLAEDPAFWYSLRNILAFVLVGVPLNIVTALIIALVLDHPCRNLKGISRTLFFLPTVTTLAAVALVWQRLYAVEGGLLNQICLWAGLPAINWLNHPWFALPALIIMTVWKGFGLNAAVFLAALQNVPEELYEQVEIDGGSWWHKIRHVTLPFLQGSMVFVFITTTVGTFHVFTEPYMMTGGGPLYATITPVLHLYQNGFQFFRLGYASAITCTLSIGVIAFNLLQQALRRRWGHTP